MSRDGTVKFYERQNKKFDDEIRESIECCSIFKDQGFLRRKESVLQTQRVHLFPFRTQKLSSAVATILYGKLYGKIVQC